MDGLAWEVAPRLLGAHIVRQFGDKQIIVRITEVEAYDQTDPASHSYKGQTKRTKTMFGPPGHLYIYFTYGMHYCCNVVTASGSAVLIRAVEVLEGIDLVRQHRPGIADPQLTNGPGKVCQALGIDRTADGHDLSQAPITLVIKKSIPANQIVQTTRIGISKAKDTLWRFYIKT